MHHDLSRHYVACIEEHPLPVYLSALPFTPIHTLLYKTFADHDIPRAGHRNRIRVRPVLFDAVQESWNGADGTVRAI
jgi:hypothetical protein